MSTPFHFSLDRRTFLARAAATVAASSALGFPMIGRGQAASTEPLKLALVGCGGRGAGAANQALTADYNTKLVAVADLFADKLAVGLKNLQAVYLFGTQVTAKGAEALERQMPDTRVVR